MYEKEKRKTTGTSSMYIKYGKRILDLLLSCLGIIFSLPLLIVIAVAIRIDTQDSAFFVQRRIGKDKKLFYIHKFRTMMKNAPVDIPTHLLVCPEQWITRTGFFLRRTSLDELPQLFDILRGKLSFIGPRPALWNQTDLISERENVGANSVLPGLTGLAQINGRDELSITEKALLDGEYVKRLSFLFDLKCFFKTITYVLSQKGIAEWTRKKIMEEQNENNSTNHGRRKRRTLLAKKSKKQTKTISFSYKRRENNDSANCR